MNSVMLLYLDDGDAVKILDFGASVFSQFAAWRESNGIDPCGEDIL